MLRAKILLLAPLACALALPAAAQYHDYNHHDHDQFYGGVREGGRGGHYDRGHDSYRYEDHHGGIGPGKGAAIGGVGGAVLGLAFGGGAKGAIIGGAAGAGIGAALGANAQHNRDERYDHR